MTEYITAPDLDTRLGPAQKASLTTAGLTPERYTQLIVEINDEVAGYVGARLLASVPAAMKHHACSIARFRLHKDNAGERIEKDLDIANKYFSDVQKGNIYLVLADDPATPGNESSSAGVWFTASPSRFTGTAY